MSRWCLLVAPEAGPGGRERPVTVDEAACLLLELLSAEGRLRLISVTRSALRGVNRDLGQEVRNRFGLWSENAPLLECVPHRTGRLHQDEVSFRVIERAWEMLTGLRAPQSRSESLSSRLETCLESDSGGAQSSHQAVKLLPMH